ncbi:SDR family oxidoreductase [Streptomyces sp. DSM 44917]|uniref:SDR family oxidoreductase n=1 Tax=Streptomyces boetiae TaxID=3075541 RepID=A0ABU2L8T5_9ACTN|nr:SDR family oxidoreductase [Streptomyces sp. DSM 44917]MDT0307985.1 SDR family oxidoreductase [Streptomyces sp. DSM 44917]
MSRVAGRTALVTGAGNGLGRAIALSLDSAGADLVLVGRDAGRLEGTARLITNGRARVATCDVSAPEAVARLAADLAGVPVSILINNAGVGGPVRPLVEVEPAEWDEVFAANVRSVFLMSRAFLPRMIAAGSGDILNVASVSGKRPLARRTPYTASKMAVLGLTRTLAFEVAPLGVTVNCVSPGPVAGPRMRGNFEREARETGTTAAEAEREFTARAAQRRMLTEREVADAVLATLSLTGLCGADIDLSAGMIAPS